MSRTGRMLAAVVLTGAVVPLGALPAHAETSTEVASNGAYFYSAGIDKPEQSPAQPPNITGDRTDGVAAGHLGVAVRLPGQEDKKSFLFFDLLEVGFDGVVSKAVVTVPLADGEGNTQMNPAPERVKACPADATGFASEDGASFAQAPKTMCDVFSVVAAPSADGKAYTFDITTMAASWVTEANNGMALVPADTASPFQVVFKPFSEASIDVEYTPGADSLTDVEDIPVEEFPTEPFDDSGTVDSGTAGLDAGGFDSGSVDAGAPAGFGTADLPAIGSELPETADAADTPEPAIAADESVPTRTVAAFSESLSPTPGLVIGGVLLLVLLAALSLIMGDPRTPAVAAARPTRLSQALQSRDRIRGLMSQSSPRS